MLLLALPVVTGSVTRAVVSLWLYEAVEFINHPLYKPPREISRARSMQSTFRVSGFGRGLSRRDGCRENKLSNKVKETPLISS